MSQVNGATRFFLLVVVCATASALSGCVANRAYRDADSRPWRHGKQDAFARGKQLPQYEPFDAQAPDHRYDLSYIEFDEKGDYWDRRQLGWTVQEIKRAAATKNLVLVVYVHGWQNDASTLRGHDVSKFQCLLNHLSTVDGNAHRFFGVYIGWRGKSVPGGDGWFREGSAPDLLAKGTFFVPHELSFFNRKDTATRVAGLPVTEAIFQSVAAARNGARESGHQAKTILVGHSFGALVLEKAMAQALAAKIISEDPRLGGKFTTPADLVVLLNSAGESIYAKEMMDMMRRRMPRGGGSSSGEISAQHPLLVSITSKADWATGKLFPIGTTLSNAGGTFRQYEWDTAYGTSSHNVSQREYFTQTPGHNNRLIGYVAYPVSGTAKPPTSKENGECGQQSLISFERNLREQLTGPNGEVEFVTASGDGAETKWRLGATEPAALRTPYWIVQVPKEIMRSHSDIFNENALAMMARLFRVSNPAQQTGVVTTSAPRTMRLMEPAPRPPAPVKKP
jgi:hypothetical protein